MRAKLVPSRAFLCVLVPLAMLACSAVADGQASSAQRDTLEVEWYLPTRDGAARLYVRERGRGPLVLVLHGGFGAEHSYLLPSTRDLEREYRFVFFDQRGSLRSPAPATSLSVDALIDDIEALRSALGEERVTLFAHSMGTYLAVRYLERYPDRVGRMVLSGAVIPRRGQLAAAEQADADSARMELPRFAQRAAVTKELEKAGLTKGPLSPRDATLAWRVQFAGANVFHVDRWRDVQGGQIYYSAAAGSALSASMPAVYDHLTALLGHRLPVTIVNGDHDVVIDRRGLPRWRRLLANAPAHVRHVVIPNAGHVTWIDEPMAFARALRSGLGAGR